MPTLKVYVAFGYSICNLKVARYVAIRARYAKTEFLLDSKFSTCIKVVNAGAFRD